MAFDEDLSQFLDLNDFAVVAQITISGGAQKTINGIFDTPSQSVQIYTTEIETDMPHLLVKTSDAAGVKKGNVCLVGGRSYKIEKVTEDGTGMSSLHLR